MVATHIFIIVNGYYGNPHCVLFIRYKQNHFCVLVVAIPFSFTSFLLCNFLLSCHLRIHRIQNPIENTYFGSKVILIFLPIPPYLPLQQYDLHRHLRKTVFVYIYFYIFIIMISVEYVTKNVSQVPHSVNKQIGECLIRETVNSNSAYLISLVKCFEIY